MRNPDPPPSSRHHRPKPIVRQNPAIAGDRPTGQQYCAAHGAYPTPPAVPELRRQATQPDMDPGYARALLEGAEKLRRTCPECRGPAATNLADVLRDTLNQQGKAQ